MSLVDRELRSKQETGKDNPFRLGPRIVQSLVILIFLIMFVPYALGASTQVKYHLYFLATHIALFAFLMVEERNVGRVRVLRYAIGLLSPFLAIGNFYWQGFHLDMTGLIMIISLLFALLNCFNAFPD